MLPWREMFRAGVSLGLSPAAFWQLSLKEWRWLSGQTASAMGRDELRGIMEDYPDAEDNSDESV